MTDKQIIEKLKTDLDFERSKRKTLQTELQAKEQECEELQSHFKQIDESNKILYQEKCELLQQLDQLKAENDLFRTCHDNEQAKRRKYEQAIEDIKEIAKKTLNMVDYKTYFKRDNKSLKQEGFKALNEILQKISEVLDEKTQRF